MKLPKIAAFEIRTDRQDFKSQNGSTPQPCRLICAAIALSDSDEVFTFYDTGPAGVPAAAMSKTTGRNLLGALRRFHNSEYRLVSWGGLGYDLEALAQHTEQVDDCGQIAWSHTDLMFQFHCRAGFPVSLRAAALGMALPLGNDRRHEVNAGELWTDTSQRERVIAATAQDAETTRAVAQACQRLRRIDWITQRGDQRYLAMPDGILTVQQAAELPQPDTSWMQDPIPRTKFYQWLT